MIRNLRDLSIYQNKDGKRLKEGMFIRSAALVDLALKDIQMLEGYKNLTVIDLRTDIERSEKPDLQLGDYHPITLMENLPSAIAHDKKSKEAIVERIPNMPELYAGLVGKELGVKGITEAFNIICNPNREGTILWHCTEGKDRCGVMSALFLKMMDFDDEVIMADYLKSHKSSKSRANKYYWIVRILLGNKQGAIAIKTAFSAKREFLEAAYAQIEDSYGSFEGFFDHIGITEEIRENMKRKYLA